MVEDVKATCKWWDHYLTLLEYCKENEHLSDIDYNIIITSNGSTYQLGKWLHAQYLIELEPNKFEAICNLANITSLISKAPLCRQHQNQQTKRRKVAADYFWMGPYHEEIIQKKSGNLESIEKIEFKSTPIQIDNDFIGDLNYISLEDDTEAQPVSSNAKSKTKKKKKIRRGGRYKNKYKHISAETYRRIEHKRYSTEEGEINSSDEL